MKLRCFDCSATKTAIALPETSRYVNFGENKTVSKTTFAGPAVPETSLMKKNTRQTTSKTTKPRSTPRHAKSTTKPVTIDLKAETVKASNEEVSSVATKGARKTETTINDHKESATEKSTPSAQQVKPKPSSNNQFGRSPEKDGKKTSTTPPPPPDAPKTSDSTSRKAGQAFVPAVIGGIVALTGAGLLQYAGLLGTPGGGDTFVSKQQAEATQARLSKKIAALEEKVQNQDISSLINQQLAKREENALANSAGDNIDVISTQVNETTLRVEKLQADFASLTTTLNQLTSAVSSGGAGEEAAVSTITSRVDAVSDSLDSLTAELNALKAQSEEIKSQPAPQSTELSGALAEIAKLQSTLPTLEKGLDEKISRLSEKMSSIDQKTSELVGLNTVVSELETKLRNREESAAAEQKNIAALEARIGDSVKAEQRAARAIAAAAVKNDIDRGVPFSQSLSNLVNLTGGSDELTKLNTFAEGGVPTVPQLSAEFESVGEKIVATLSPKPKDDVTSRLLAGAKAFIKVKTVETLPGTSPEAVVSQIANALTKGDLEKASALWNALPEEGRNVSQNWHDKLQGRLEANALVADTIQTFLLSGPTR